MTSDHIELTRFLKNGGPLTKRIALAPHTHLKGFPGRFWRPDCSINAVSRLNAAVRLASVSNARHLWSHGFGMACLP